MPIARETAIAVGRVRIADHPGLVTLRAISDSCPPSRLPIWRLEYTPIVFPCQEENRDKFYKTSLNLSNFLDNSQAHATIKIRSISMKSVGTPRNKAGCLCHESPMY